MSRYAYDAFDDPYCYPKTTTLKNLLNIRDEAQLEAFELEISTLRSEEPLPCGGFDSKHYCKVHHHLFQDIYEWAGQYRTVRTSKAGNAFCYPDYIATEMDRLFQKFGNGERFGNCDQDQFAHGIATFLSELNAIHPFREGNGRSQLAFIGLLGVSFDHPFNFERLDREKFIPAMIESFVGNTDPLIKELTTILS